MGKDDRDLLDVLKMELDFVEKGGYGRSVRTPWLRTSTFQDSISCLEFPDHAHDDGCLLMELVPPEARRECVPCHHIPLNRAGETADILGRRGDQAALEEALKNWLRSMIKKMEEERAEAAA